MKLVTIQLNQFIQKIAAIHKIPSPTGKVALMSFIGALNFYTKFIEKLHINLKPFYDLLHEKHSLEMDRRTRKSIPKT